MSVDISFFYLINNLAGKFWVLDWLSMFLADYLGYFLILGALFVFLKEKKWQRRFYFAALTSLSVILARGIITEAIRFFYVRPRPFTILAVHQLINHSASASFPSGHTAAYFALGLAVFYFLYDPQVKITKNWGTWFLILAFLMGISRIFVGLHWPTDILGGALIGIGSTYLIKQILTAPPAKEEKSF